MLPQQWRERLRVPVIAAPMTDVSGPELVAAACAAGVIGAFPAHNAAGSGELGRGNRRRAQRRPTWSAGSKTSCGARATS
jgi:nitronate monooxygenase